MSQQINLYNPALRQPRELVSAVNLAIAVGISLLLVIVVGGAARYSLHSATADAASAAQVLKLQQDQLAAMTAQLATQHPNAALQREVDAAQSLLKSREEVLAALDNVSIEPGKGFAGYLRGLARQSLLGVWLTGVSVGPGNELSISGRTLNQSLVADYVKRLTGEPVFAGHRFAQMTMGRVVEPKPGSSSAQAATTEPPVEFKLETSPSPVVPFGAGGAGSAAASVSVASLEGGRS